MSEVSAAAEAVSVYAESPESGGALRLISAEFENGLTTVSADLFFEAVNISYFYDRYSNMYVSDGSTEIYCCLDENVFMLKKVEPENCVVYGLPVSRRGSSVFVPLRLIAECFGYNVAWDGNTKSVYLSKPSAEACGDLPLSAEYEVHTSEGEKLRLFCMLKRASLEAAYGVTVKYSAETEGYSPRGRKVYPLLGDSEVFVMLSRIENVFSLYSTSFFRGIAQHGVELSFYLINRFDDGLFTGLTDRQDKNNIIITVTDCENFERVVNHEIMHYIETALLSVEAERTASGGGVLIKSCFPLWSRYNPTGFSYGILNSDYVDSAAGDVYFTDVYSKINEREDRANVFEALMSCDFRNSSSENQCLLAKARYLIFEISSRLPFADFLQSML